MQLEKVYEPQRFEPHWAQWWIESGIYHADAEATAQNSGIFSIVIPPPNVTGSLHIGHFFEHTMMDAAVRWHRMRGEKTLWVPGTDHAGIATQMVVERQLSSEGLMRQQLGRGEFERRVWQWKEEYGGRINTQIRREGASVDWSRERFTLDPGLSRAVREAFVRLWDKGLIYRGEYMVNWCPRCQTAISDLETIHEATEGHLWHVRYQVAGSDEFLTVATTRPETILGDTAIAVHPDDARYQHLHGKNVTLPLLGRQIPVIADSIVDPKFGTGAVKVTPAHDPNDFEIGKRHKLPFIKVIGEDARMTAAAGPYADLDRFEARKRVLAALGQSGELVKTEPYTVNLSKCDRCKTIIEPLVSTQWFMHMKPLAEKAMEAVRSGQIRFVPDDREGLFFQWMENIRDWCISRQLWWGHRIPAWHCRNCSKTTVAREAPATCPHCHSTELEQESDVLDTWFSSGLWPFSTLGWPDDTADLRTFYPTSLLITGFDILFFWLSRMIMLGIEMTGEVPFREVHIHGLVRDADKQKMSKTRGNVIDPLVIMDRYGTDACRMALLLSAAAGSDIALKEDRMESGRAFANKVWNASRLLFMNMERSRIENWTPLTELPVAPSTSLEDIWIFDRLNVTTETVNRALTLHRYHEAAQTLWDFIWHDFCDWYLEIKKLRFQENSGIDAHWQATLAVYERALRLLHPFMPFVTEELWQRLIHGVAANADQPRSISVALYPTARGDTNANKRAEQFTLLQQIVTNAREFRADHKLDPKATIDATLKTTGVRFEEQDLAAISALARLKIEAQFQPEGKLEFSLQLRAPQVSQNGILSAEARQRILKENAGLERAIENSERQLHDPTFVSKAPSKVVESLREKVAGYRVQLDKNRALLESNHEGTPPVFDIDHPQIRNAVQIALEEDIGSGDVTSELTVPERLPANGRFLAKESFIVAGVELLPLIYTLRGDMRGGANVQLSRKSGDAVQPGDTIATVSGAARTLLECERVALNFLQRLSGVATLARRHVEALAGTKVKVLDTRKTTPGLRLLEKHAAAAGGATNHRQGLFDAVLIKNNHITAAGGVRPALEKAKAFKGTVEIEVRTPDELEDALACGAKHLLLDNLTPQQAREWIQSIAGRATTELSGNIRLDNIRPYAEAGPDYISCGAITHSATAVDISFRLQL